MLLWLNGNKSLQQDSKILLCRDCSCERNSCNNSFMPENDMFSNNMDDFNVCGSTYLVCVLLFFFLFHTLIASSVSDTVFLFFFPPVCPGYNMVVTGCQSDHSQQALSCKMSAEYDGFMASDKRWDSFRHIHHSHRITDLTWGKLGSCSSR